MHASPAAGARFGASVEDTLNGSCELGEAVQEEAPLSRVLPCGVDPLHGILRRGKSQTSNDQLTVSVGDLGLPSVYGQASSVEYRALSDMRALFGL